jgi:hypothetical protein
VFERLDRRVRVVDRRRQRLHRDVRELPNAECHVLLSCALEADSDGVPQDRLERLRVRRRLIGRLRPDPQQWRLLHDPLADHGGDGNDDVVVVSNR